jgi:hypothetical protein
MEYNKIVDGEKLSREKFRVPSEEFGIMPFWFWNGELDYKEMEYQLKEYKAKGIPGIFLHARFGILNYMGYLSDDWFDRVKFTVEKAREIGLQIWVYDEYNWPSGTACNQVQKNDPDLTQRYLELIEMDIPGQFFTFLEGTDSRYHDMEQSEPIYACAILQDDLKNGRPNFIDLMPSLSFNKVITWEAPKGPWKLFYFIERKASWYIDALDEESTKKFLELTHEEYKKCMGGSFKGNIKGFYTDEPAMHYFETGKDNHIIPWSRKMFKIFRNANGYDLKPHLAKLFYDIGDAEKVRYDFWSSLTKQYEQTYYKQISDWCKKNDVLFTGHLLYEESLRMHARTGGNLFNHLKHMDLIGVDHLYPRIGTREMPNEHVALKIASSAAHQFGSVRLLCESLGGSYWDVTMERMKWIADWEYVLGVNLFNPHGFHYSVEGERKRDWPPSQFYQHTWWKDYRLFNDYVTRMGYVLSGGKHVAKIAVLYPMNSIWTNYTPQTRNSVGEAIESDFNFITDTLLRLHTDFDYIDEDVLKGAEIKGSKICIRDEEYELLILPPVTHIKESTLKFMEVFCRAGGKLLGDTLLPYGCVEGNAENFSKRVCELFGRNPEELKASFMRKEKSDCSFIVSSNEAGGKAVLIEGPGLNKAKPAALLKASVLECIKPEIEIDSDEVFYLHRVKDGKDFFFIINPVEMGREINVSIRAKGRPELWNLENGDMEKLNVFKRNGDAVSFRLGMQPYGSALVTFCDQEDGVHIEDTNVQITSIEGDRVNACGRVGGAYAKVNRNGKVTDTRLPGLKPLDKICFNESWDFSTNLPNNIILSSFKFALDEDDKGEEAGFCKERFDDSKWLDFKIGAWEMQLPEERELKTYPVTVWYRSEFEARYIPDDIKLLVDGFKGNSYDLFINGRRVTEAPSRSYIDAEMKQLPIKNYVKEGRNSVAIRISVSSKTDGLLDLLKITGSFELERDGSYYLSRPERCKKTGSWTKQGYPFFSGTGEYTQAFTVDKAYTGKVLKLNISCGKDIAEVLVNGKAAGTRPWLPYELDITPFIKEGENTISIRITNTLVNIMEAVEQDSGLFDACIVPYDIYEF